MGKKQMHIAVGKNLRSDAVALFNDFFHPRRQFVGSVLVHVLNFLLQGAQKYLVDDAGRQNHDEQRATCKDNDFF